MLLLIFVFQESGEIVEQTKTIAKILEACILTSDIDINSLATFDLEYIFLQLRSKSVGEIAEPIIHCEKCEKDVPLKIDLSKVKMKFTKYRAQKSAHVNI